MIGNKSISLCMVVYNPGQLLERAINSVKEIVDEIVIVDQGSSDEESANIKKLATFYTKTTNKGNADYDRMFCYSLAQKDYILALDSDEWIDAENIEKTKKLIEKYDFDCNWFLFKNTISSNGITIDLKDMLGDDPHPRLWKRFINIGGRVTPTVIWSHEAHRYPDINSRKQIFSDIYFNHERILSDVIKTHLGRGKNINPEAQETEKKFIREVLNRFGLEVKKDIVLKIPELKNYLKG